MGIPIGNNGVLQHAKIDMSHQEMARLVEHLEELWQGCKLMKCGIELNKVLRGQLKL